MATKSNPARGARQQEWLEPLEACRVRSLRLKAYAEQAGLDVPRLYHWRRQLKAHGLLADTCQLVPNLNRRISLRDSIRQIVLLLGIGTIAVLQVGHAG